MAQSQQTEIQVFSGGIHTRVSPHLMEQSESVILSNVDIRSGALVSKREHTSEEDKTLSMFYWFQGVYYYYDAYRSNVSWNGVYYWADAFDVKKFVPTVGELPVGVNPPTQPPTLALSAASAEGLTGKYTYVYTYIDKATGVESPPSPPAISVVASNQAITVSGLVAEPSAQAYEIRLYRVGEGITVFTSVITLGDSITSYKDELHFTQIEANLLQTARAFPPESQMVNLTQSRGRFYGSVGSFLRWSAQGKPDSWYILDSMDFPEEISMIAQVANELIVCTRYQTWLVVGGTPLRFQRHLISASEGCVSNQSLAVYNGTAMWLSDDGIVGSNGSSLQNLTITKLDRITGIDPVSATVHNNTYYLGYTEQLFPSDDLYPSEELLPATVESKQEFPTGIYIVDFSFPDPRVLFSFQNDIGYLDTAGDYLDMITRSDVPGDNIITEDGLYNLIDESGVNNIVTEAPNADVRFHMFNGDGFQHITYLSPLFTEGSVGTEKQFEKARVTFRGDFHVVLRDHNSEIFAETDISSVSAVSEWVGISPTKNRGFGIQYDISGTGQIFSLSHVWTPRESQ